MQSSSEHPQILPRIVIDVMGSDYGPQEIIAGVRLALTREASRIGKLFLVGDKAVVEPIFLKNGLDNYLSIELVHASQTISMEEKPMQALKQKKDASMFKAIELVKAGQAEAVLSCGNTGCLMAGSTLKLRTLPGVNRPALASIIPTKTSRFILMDVGANPVSSVEYLVHNAVLGSHFSASVLNLKSPKIGLLTIGTEEGKGNEVVQNAHEILKQLNGKSLNYYGLIEGFDLFAGKVDVVVCDGFVGNILLKTCESLFSHLKEYLKAEFCRNSVRKLGALLSCGVFKAMKKQFSPDKFSGAPLLGLNGWVFKSHGSSKAEAIAGGLNMCLNCLEFYNEKTLQSDIALANELMNSAKENISNE